MGTLAEEAAYLSGTKTILKNTIASNLGRTIPDGTNFRDYQNYILPPATWMPDPLWPSLTDTADGQICMIVRDRDDLGVAARCAFTVTATAAYVVDWGDGTSPETVVSTVMADHTYTLGAGTPDSKGTTTFKVRISSTGTITRILMANNVTGGVVKQTVQSVNIKAAGITSMADAFRFCRTLENIYSLNVPNCTSMSGAFYYCTALLSVGALTLTSCTTMLNMFSSCVSLQSVGDLNIPNCTTMSSAFNGCMSLKSIGGVTAPLCGNVLGMCYNGVSLQSIGDISSIGTSATSVDGSDMFYRIPFSGNIDIPNAKLTKIAAFGASDRLSGITGLTFNASSTFSGSSPQINVSYTMMTRTALVALFNLLPTLVGKTINITGCIGTADLTAGDRAIATGKGWTITG